MSEMMKMAVLKAQEKNMVVGILLTFFFGGLGLFYVSIKAGIIGIIIGFVLLVLTIVTLGIGYILYFPYWVICIIYAANAINKYNRKLYARAAAQENKAKRTEVEAQAPAQLTE